MSLPRPLCNRVTPFGQLIATSSRGALMGNRGKLLAPDGSLRSGRWTTESWVCCRLEFRGWRVPLWQPGHYMPLFFFDEAVALAAGHRPCGQCRHQDLTRFKQAWLRAYGRSPDSFISAERLTKTCTPLASIVMETKSLFPPVSRTCRMACSLRARTLQNSLAWSGTAISTLGVSTAMESRCRYPAMRMRLFLRPGQAWKQSVRGIFRASAQADSFFLTVRPGPRLHADRDRQAFQ